MISLTFTKIMNIVELWSWNDFVLLGINFLVVIILEKSKLLWDYSKNQKWFIYFLIYIFSWFVKWWYERYKITWRGSLVWVENEGTIYPLASEAGRTTSTHCIQAKIIPRDNTDAINWQPESLCKYLKVGFFYNYYVSQMVIAYMAKANSGEHLGDNELDTFLNVENADRVWCAVKIKFEKSPESERFINFLKSGISAIVTDHQNNKSMAIGCLKTSKHIVGYIPYNQTLFNSIIHEQLYNYFVAGYEILHGRRLLYAILLEVKQIADAMRENKDEEEVSNELLRILHLTEEKDHLKRDFLRSILWAPPELMERISVR